MSDALQEEKTLQQPDTQQQGIESQISMDRPIPVLIIQSHPDLIRVGDIARLEALLDNQVIDLARGKLDFCRGNSVLGKPLADPYLSRSAINIKMLANDELVFDCSDSKTTLTVGETVVDSSITLSTAQMATGVVITLGERVTLLLKSQLLKSQLSKSSLSTHRPMSSDFNMVGVSAKLMEVKQQLASLRGVDECVMITGATGVGKELVTQAIYDVSNRVGAPFVKVSLGSISSALAAAELFGASKGAYTGADKNRNGYFAAAQGGTLFL
ncbi:MAG: sigma 54-interacting transcriptional regulator, partial [Algicola sp.]|nr:sigma 54-interacting transcriptional regulator [Algicola sp.]